MSASTQGSTGVSLDALTSAGLFTVPGFLPEDVCAELCSAIRSAEMVTATVARDGRDHVLDTRIRRTHGARVPEQLHWMVRTGLAALGSRLAEHFGMALGEPEAPQFLAYGKGDFFRPHQDNSRDPALPEFIRRRRVSVVLFLGRQTRLPEPDSYCGGELTFFRLPGLSGVDGIRARVWGQPGLLVAFDSGQLHEVAPVTHGFRASTVSWFPTADPT
jgi:predicted 2-oxoglutarate/Fe(II)-dependent dioxygenase YbiX